MTDDTLARVRARRRELLGAAQDDAIAAAEDAFDRPFQDYARRNVWGATWLNGVLPARELALVNIGMLAGLGRFEEMGVYVGVARRLGVPVGQLQELLMHITVYCGTPVGRQAFKAARAALTLLLSEKSHGDDES
ncbi:carboxymuconolactone decarboxylase family protein [Pigmentiphaga daeguensis]|uniref:Carboxymuconolactone decarboxylase family protein n=1 Tax=Pigmentiphaga daeguensis TaxID=414049 RepID=A0ABN1CBD5_9BURK